MQVVGLKNLWHMSLVMAGLAHGVRIAQCRGARLEIRTTEPAADGEPGAAYMQLDGEPWKQQIPSRQGDPPLLVSLHAPFIFMGVPAHLRQVLRVPVWIDTAD